MQLFIKNYPILNKVVLIRMTTITFVNNFILNFKKPTKMYN